MLESDSENEDYKTRVKELSKNDPYYSILKDKTISNENVALAEESWQKQNMSMFAVL